MSHSLEVCITHSRANVNYAYIFWPSSSIIPMRTEYTFICIVVASLSHHNFPTGKSDGTVFSPTAMEAKDLYAQNFLGRRGHDAEQGKHPEERGTINGTPLMENTKSPFLSDSNFSVFRFLGYYNFGGFTANSLAQYLLKDVEFFFTPAQK